MAGFEPANFCTQNRYDKPGYATSRKISIYIYTYLKDEINLAI